MRTVRTGRGQEVVETSPESCPNGHELRHPNVQVFGLPCTCMGEPGVHRGWRCWTCGAVIYDPPHDPTVTDQGSAYG